MFVTQSGEFPPLLISLTLIGTTLGNTVAKCTFSTSRFSEVP